MEKANFGFQVSQDICNMLAGGKCPADFYSLGRSFRARNRAIKETKL